MIPLSTLSLDAGQTGTKVRLDADGSAPIEFVLPGVRTDTALLPQLSRVAHEAYRRTGHAAATVAYGVSGLTDDGADVAELLALLGDIGTTRVLLAHDSVTSFLGTLGDARGAVIAAGTGVVTLGVGGSRVARVDGWGNIMGDAGSAYWIGREALDAAMRAYDGRGPETALLDTLRNRWPSVEDAYIDLQNDPNRVRVVASFAASVTELADADSTAGRICLQAARELSSSVVAALTRVGEPAGVYPAPDVSVVSAIGGVFRSKMIRARFEDLVREAVPSVEIQPPRGSGLDGVAALPELAAAHPLRTLIFDSSQ